MCTPTQRILCSGECDTCFGRSLASDPKAIYWGDNGTITPRSIKKNNVNQFKFNCPCGHVILKTPHSITQGSWCPHCSNPPKFMCKSETCEICFLKSFAFNVQSQFWSNKNEKTPRQTYANDNKKYWFDCVVCKHEFDMPLNAVARGNWCPYCAHQKICDSPDCEFCYNNSFACSARAESWSKKNIKTSREVFLGDNRKYLFDCNVCKHEFLYSPNQITNNGYWCPYCGKKRLCDDPECLWCYNASFCAHPRSNFWSYRNDKHPRDVFMQTRDKYWFICEEGHEFDASLYNIFNEYWCPGCMNKTEGKLNKFLKTVYPETRTQAKYDWCKDQTYLPYDFVIEKLKVIIELDGGQHFIQVSNWKAPEITRATDIYKIEKALENGYTIIHVLQEYVADDRNKWQEMLINVIEIHKGTNLAIFINENDEYKEHAIAIPYRILHENKDYINS
jgi:hypothetical protein